MNNQFATQYLLEEMEDEYVSLENALRELGTSEDAIKVLMSGVRTKNITPEGAIEIAKLTVKGVHETSSVGGMVAGGPTAATATDGPGEQVAGSNRAFKKKTFGEGTFEGVEIAIFDGGEDGLTKIYRKEDGSYYGVNDEFNFTAKDMQELSHKLAMWGYKHLSGTFYEDAPRLAGNPSKTTKQGAKNLSAYSSVGFTKAPDAEEAAKQMKGIDVDMLWKEGDINESRAYSRFKKEAATRTKDQQMHEAVKMIHNRLAEVSKILEYAQQMRAELSEGEQTLEYNHNTKKMFERINSKVVEIYTKTRQLK